MKNIMIILFTAIILLLLFHSTQTCLEGFSKNTSDDTEIKSLALPVRNYTDINKDIEVSWYLQDGQCKKIKETPKKTQEMIKMLGGSGTVYNNKDDCTKSIKHHQPNDKSPTGNNKHHNIIGIDPKRKRKITFICEKNNGMSEYNNPHLNPNIHYSTIHLNTNPSIQSSLYAQLY